MEQGAALACPHPLQPPANLPPLPCSPPPPLPPPPPPPPLPATPTPPPHGPLQFDASIYDNRVQNFCQPSNADVCACNSQVSAQNGLHYPVSGQSRHGRYYTTGDTQQRQRQGSWEAETKLMAWQHRQQEGAKEGQHVYPSNVAAEDSSLEMHSETGCEGKEEDEEGLQGRNTTFRDVADDEGLPNREGDMIGKGEDPELESFSGGELSMVVTSLQSRSEKKRRSRWEPEAEGDVENDGVGTRKRKSRWGSDKQPLLSQIQLPDFVKELTGGVDLDPELQALNFKLLDITRKLQSGQFLDDTPDSVRSPSPEPIYDNMGLRINTREYRIREKLTRDRQEIIAELIQKNPNYRPPSDYRPPKLYKKLYIPIKEYPGYNFIGLIIGPRGNTQKRMERETGTKIIIKGKGAMKEGRSQYKRDYKPDPSDNEDIHVLIEAESQDALEKAGEMVQKLLVPVEEGRNEHKRAQLRELAALNGTIRDDEICRACGVPGHRQYACPDRNTLFRSDVSCSICGDGGHPTIDCPLKGFTQGNKMDDEYKSFLAELGGGRHDSESPSGDAGSTRSFASTLVLPGPEGKTVPPWTNTAVGGSGGLLVDPRGAGSGAGGNPFYQLGNGDRFSKDTDGSNLYVGYLPPSVDEEGLMGLFAPFGRVESMKLIRDKLNGSSKGYGFVKYTDPSCAALAVSHMNGYRLEGRMLAVRIAGKPPLPGTSAGATSVPDIRGPNGHLSHQYEQPQQCAPHPPGGAVVGGSPSTWMFQSGPPWQTYGPPPPGNHFGTAYPNIPVSYSGLNPQYGGAPPYVRPPGQRPSSEAYSSPPPQAGPSSASALLFQSALAGYSGPPSEGRVPFEYNGASFQSLASGRPPQPLQGGASDGQPSSLSNNISSSANVATPTGILTCIGLVPHGAPHPSQTQYQAYPCSPMPLNSAPVQPPPQAGATSPPPWATDSTVNGQQQHIAVESEYEKFMSEMGHSD